MGQGHIARSAAQFPGDLAIESVEYAAAQVVPDRFARRRDKGPASTQLSSYPQLE